MNMNNNFNNMNMNNNLNNMNMNNNFNMNFNNININFNNNNNFIFNNPNQIFSRNEYGSKTLYRNIINIDNNNYFIATSSKHFKEEYYNKINHIFYLSLFNYNSMEEITKIEIDRIELDPDIIIKFELNKINNYILIKIDSYQKIYLYEFIYEKGELLDINDKKQ